MEKCRDKVRNSEIPVRLAMEESVNFIASALGLGWNLDEIKIILALKAFKIKRETSLYKIKIDPGSKYIRI